VTGVKVIIGNFVPLSL